MFTRICGHNIRQLVHLQGKAGFLKGFLHPGKPKPSIEDSTLADFNPKPHRNQTTPVHWWQQQPNITQPRDAAPAAFEEPQIATPSWPIRNPNALAPELRICHAWKLDQTLTEWPMVTRVQMLSDLGKSWEMSPVLVKAVGQTPRKKSLLSYLWISASQTSQAPPCFLRATFLGLSVSPAKRQQLPAWSRWSFPEDLRLGKARRNKFFRPHDMSWGWVHSTSQR